MVLYTIGYEGRTVEEFIIQFKNHNINTLIDVRENPYSRKKGFSKSFLSEYLESNGIEYIHFKELGTPKHLRDKLKLDGNHKYFIEEYSRHLIL